MFYFASPYLKSRENAVPSFPFFHRRRRLSAKSEHKPNKSLGHKERCHLPWLKMSLKNHRFDEVNFDPLFEFSVLQTRMIPKSLLIKNVRCWLEPDSVFTVQIRTNQCNQLQCWPTASTLIRKPRTGWMCNRSSSDSMDKLQTLNWCARITRNIVDSGTETPYRTCSIILID